MAIGLAHSVGGVVPGTKVPVNKLMLPYTLPASFEKTTIFAENAYSDGGDYRYTLANPMKKIYRDTTQIEWTFDYVAAGYSSVLAVTKDGIILRRYAGAQYFSAVLSLDGQTLSAEINTIRWIGCPVISGNSIVTIRQTSATPTVSNTFLDIFRLNADGTLTTILDRALSDISPAITNIPTSDVSGQWCGILEDSVILYYTANNVSVPPYYRVSFSGELLETGDITKYFTPMISQNRFQLRFFRSHDDQYLYVQRHYGAVPSITVLDANTGELVKKSMFFGVNYNTGGNLYLSSGISVVTRDGYIYQEWDLGVNSASAIKYFYIVKYNRMGEMVACDTFDRGLGKNGDIDTKLSIAPMTGGLVWSYQSAINAPNIDGYGFVRYPEGQDEYIVME